MTTTTAPAFDPATIVADAMAVIQDDDFLMSDLDDLTTRTARVFAIRRVLACRLAHAKDVEAAIGHRRGFGAKRRR